ncbi:site-specific integrase [Lacihabitans sp. CCS-44]|uniref:site-specific integrase n=1 Tax=Lacihabitans sp. CCS-44 TaxID=2487331 RepID=UPI0020CBEA6F|nr:site-specific integrase [Lacihabitans sp. CCS-44]
MTKVKRKFEMPNDLESLRNSLSESKTTRVPKLGVSFSERFDKTQKNQSVIYLTVTYLGRAYKKSLAIRCKTGSLNRKTFEIKNEESKSQLLKAIESKIQELATNLRITGKRIEPQRLIESVLTKNNIINQTPSFNDICYIISEEVKQSYLHKDLSKKSFQRYLINIERITDFFEFYFNKSRIELDEINSHSIERLIFYLKKEKDFQPETIRKVLQIGNRAYRIAQMNKYYEYNPFINIRLDRSKSTLQNHLTKDEIQKIYKLELNNKIYSDIRDFFVFQCYSSLAYTDLKNLKHEHLVEVEGKKTIRKAREKTTNFQTIHLYPIAIEILEKHFNPKSKFCFKVYSNTHHNRVLKEIAQIANINKPISTHWGRKSFSQMMVRNGLSKESLQGVLGHSSMKTTEKHYANISTERTLIEMESLTIKII